MRVAVILAVAIGLTGFSASAKPARIGDADRNAVAAYVQHIYAQGKCPPGMAREGEVCAPQSSPFPGWRKGKVLPAGVEARPVPASMAKVLSPAPRGHRYVIVGSDILLIRTANRVVVDAMIVSY